MFGYHSSITWAPATKGLVTATFNHTLPMPTFSGVLDLPPLHL